MTEIVATNVVASRPPNGYRLQRRLLAPIYASDYFSDFFPPNFKARKKIEQPFEPKKNRLPWPEFYKNSNTTGYFACHLIKGSLNLLTLATMAIP